MVIFQRAATSKILESAKYFPVIAILGPRQSGKTTLAQIIFQHHRYLSLEDLDLHAEAQHGAAISSDPIKISKIN